MKLKMLMTGAVGLFVAASTVPGSAATNLLTNGSFENGFAGWTLGGTETQGYPEVVINYNSATPYPTGAFNEAVPPATGSASPDAVGTHAAYFVSDFANETLSQMVYLMPGVYTIGFSAYAPNNGYQNAGDAAFSGSVAGVTLASYNVSAGPDTTWQDFTGVANIASAGWYNTSFAFSTNLFPSKDIVIDQAFIVAGTVPEASTWAMILAGFGGVALLARRARAKVSLPA